MTRYKVVGGCRVAGVEPGGIVTQKQLEDAKANVSVLIGYHLEPIREEAEKSAAKPKAAGRGR